MKLSEVLPEVSVERGFLVRVLAVPEDLNFRRANRQFIGPRGGFRGIELPTEVSGDRRVISRGACVNFRGETAAQLE